MENTTEFVIATHQCPHPEGSQLSEVPRFGSIPSNRGSLTKALCKGDSEYDLPRVPYGLLIYGAPMYGSLLGPPHFHRQGFRDQSRLTQRVSASRLWLGMGVLC